MVFGSSPTRGPCYFYLTAHYSETPILRENIPWDQKAHLFNCKFAWKQMRIASKAYALLYILFLQLLGPNPTYHHHHEPLASGWSKETIYVIIVIWDYM